MKVKKEFINQLKKDWKVTDLARELGFSQGAMSNILNGTREPSKRFIIEVMNTFGMELKDFIQK